MKTKQQQIEQLNRICDNLNVIAFEKYMFPHSSRYSDTDIEIIENRLKKLWAYLCTLKGFINRKQAKEQLLKGAKIKHCTFSNDAYIYHRDGQDYLFNGKHTLKINFNKYFKGDLYEEYWLS